MATLSSTPAEFAAVGVDNWQDRVSYWALFALDNGWAGKASALLEVGRARHFGHTVDDEFCSIQVARLIGDIYELATIEGKGL